MSSSSHGRWAVDPVSQVELWVPDYATPDSAFRREELKRAGLLPVIRFFPEVSNGWLIWTVGSAETPEDFGLSESLCAALQVLNDAWQDERLWEEGEWSSPEAEEAWMRKADELADWVEREVWNSAEVVRRHRRGSG